MATNSRTFEVKFVGDTKGLVKSFKDIQKQANVLGSSVKSASSVMKASLAGISFYQVARGMQSAVLAASNLSESIAKSNTVFSSNKKEIEAWSKTTSKAFGVNRQAALEAAGTYGNLFRAFGVSEKKAYEMSTSLVELAADMASFNNVPIDQALTALRSGLSGEAEPLKRFGVGLTEARLKAEAAANGMGNFTGTLPPAIRMQAAYSLVLKDTALQQGDVARTSGGLANQMKFLQAGLADAKAGFGEVLMPAALSFVTMVNQDLIPALNRIVEALKLEGAAGGLKQLKTELSNVLSSVQGVAAQVKTLIFTLIGIKTATVLVAALRTAWAAVAVQVGATATATQIAAGVMKRALISTGWGALVVVLGSVIGRLMEVSLTADETNKSLQQAFSGKNIAMVEGMNMAVAQTANNLAATAINANALAQTRADDKLLNINKSTLVLGKTTPVTTKAIDDLTKSIGGSDADKGASAAAEAAKKAIDAFKDSLNDAKSKLENAKDAFKNFASEVSGSITSVINFGDAANAETGTFLENLVAQAAKASEFGTKIQQLLSMGLSEKSISQVLSAGADAGIKIADEIIAGGATVVNQVNTLISATQTLADKVGQAGAELFYSAGVSQGEALVQGVVDAIKAAGFTIQGTLADTIAAPVEAAKTAAVTATKTTTTSKTKTPTKTTSAPSYTSAQQRVLQRFGVPLMADGGIVNKPTLAMIGEAGPEAVVPLGKLDGGTKNYNITVNAGMGTNGALIGKEIVDAIKRYERSSGPVFASA